MTACRHCGYRNPDDTIYCGSCGWPLREESPDEPIIIDVTENDVEIVISGDEEVHSRSFTTTFVGPSRVYVSSSGNRACLITLAVILLAVCCACGGWLIFIENVLF